jgi:hypothetical protein
MLSLCSALALLPQNFLVYFTWLFKKYNENFEKQHYSKTVTMGSVSSKIHVLRRWSAPSLLRV